MRVPVVGDESTSPATEGFDEFTSEELNGIAEDFDESVALATEDSIQDIDDSQHDIQWVQGWPWSLHPGELLSLAVADPHDRRHDEAVAILEGWRPTYWVRGSYVS